MTELPVAFLGTFESLRMGPTFARGRRDERAGHVRSLTISSSLVVAQVRGPDDPRAFRSRIAVRAFGASEWAALETALAAEARFTAQLLDGRMPAGIGEVFAAAGLSLVPLSLDEVAMDCTCERWPMPCIHLAATCYAVARSFQEDPFGAFAWRGRGRDELLTHLRELRNALAVTASDRAGGSSARAGSHPARAGSPSARGETPSAHRAADAHDAHRPAYADRAGDPDRAGDGHRAGDPDRAGDAQRAGDPDRAGDAQRAGDPHRAGGAQPGGDADSSAGTHHAADGHRAADASSPSPVSSFPVDLGEALGEVADFWGSSIPPAAPVGGRPGAVTRPDALLDQLDPPPLAEGGRPLVEVLRPAYLALPDE